MPKPDITSESDITLLVHRFYDKVRADELLAPIFNHTIEHNWDKHLQRMCDFWSTLLLYSKKYLEDPISKHLHFPLSPIHFERWLFLFEQTVHQHFEGETANLAIKKANTIAQLMQLMNHEKTT